MNLELKNLEIRFQITLEQEDQIFILLGTLIFKFYGWKIEGSLPNKKRVIITAAPHTSYEDFIRAFPLSFSTRHKS